MDMQNAIAVINAGSSSIKFSLFEEAEGTDVVLFLKGQVEGLYTDNTHFLAEDTTGTVVAEQRWTSGDISHDSAMRHLLSFIDTHLDGHRIDAVGHRIVHGGGDFTAPVLLDPRMIGRLRDLTPLAPLHQPHNLAPATAIFNITPGLPQVGCFDTAFHAGQDPLVTTFGLPQEITARGVRRYGFHGLSYEYVASLLPALDPYLAAGKVIIAHLGNGASLCALKNGRSVASSMGFTAVDGLMMGTRCGSLDPGVILYLIDELRMGRREIEALIYKQSGLLGVSGISSDMRTLEADGSPAARFAIDLFIYRIVREIGSLAAALGGLDALIFTAGIGEHSAHVRHAVSEGCGWLGVSLDAAANAAGGHYARRLSPPDSRVPVWVVPTDEELMIARHTYRLRNPLAPALLSS